MKRQRVIEQLRKLFPNETWRYDPLGYRWICDSFEVFGESHDYDESSGYHTVRYKRNDTFELIKELGFRREYCG